MQCLTHSPTFTTAPTNGANILYDEENMLTRNHEDSDVPQQCARARAPSFLMKAFLHRKVTILLGVQNKFLQGL